MTKLSGLHLIKMFTDFWTFENNQASVGVKFRHDIVCTTILFHRRLFACAACCLQYVLTPLWCQIVSSFFILPMLRFDYLRSHFAFVRLYLPNGEVTSHITVFSVIRSNYIDSMELYGELTWNRFKPGDFVLLQIFFLRY